MFSFATPTRTFAPQLDKRLRQASCAPVRGRVVLDIREYTLAEHLHRLVADGEGLRRHLRVRSSNASSTIGTDLRVETTQASRRGPASAQTNILFSRFLPEREDTIPELLPTSTPVKIICGGKNLHARGAQQSPPRVLLHNDILRLVTSPSVTFTGIVTVATSTPSSLPFSDIAQSCIAAAVTTSLAAMKCSL